jgi:molybdate transport system substrate-binding protein
MRQLFRKLIASSLIIAFLFSCGTGTQKDAISENTNSELNQPIMVYAAASLTDVISEIVDSFEVKYNVRVQINLASSGTHVRQIEQGGSPDVIISASNQLANYIDSMGYMVAGTKTIITKNELVLISPVNSTIKIEAIDSSLDFLSLLGTNRLSMGDPLHVPAGKYAKQSLEYFGWYSKLEGKILPSKDVRSALMVVEMEEAPLGIVYRTDAQKSTKVKILGIFPEPSHKPIVYVGGICKDNSTAKAFFEYVNSDATKAIWAKNGFIK